MLVTINTDASFSHEHKIGSFAYWIVCDQGKITMSGVLKEAKNPSDAELRCIANALYTILNSNLFMVTKIIINSDALTVFNKVKKNSKDPIAKEVANILTRIKQKYLKPNERHKIIHEFRHVKAHSGIGSKRKYVNDWCDKEAKRQLRTKITQGVGSNSGAA